MAIVHRHFLGRFKGHVIYNWVPANEVDWNLKTVLVTASEGHDPNPVGSSDDPQRFVGSANITVENIAPRAGGLTARIHVDWDEPLPIWVDIRVFDADVPNEGAEQVSG